MWRLLSINWKWVFLCLTAGLWHFMIILELAKMSLSRSPFRQTQTQLPMGMTSLPNNMFAGISLEVSGSQWDKSDWMKERGKMHRWIFRAARASNNPLVPSATQTHGHMILTSAGIGSIWPHLQNGGNHVQQCSACCYIYFLHETAWEVYDVNVHISYIRLRNISLKWFWNYILLIVYCPKMLSHDHDVSRDWLHMALFTKWWEPFSILVTKVLCKKGRTFLLNVFEIIYCS